MGHRYSSINLHHSCGGCGVFLFSEDEEDDVEVEFYLGCGGCGGWGDGWWSPRNNFPPYAFW